MKKLSLLLCVLLCGTLAACQAAAPAGTDAPSSPATETAAPVQPTPTAEPSQPAIADRPAVLYIGTKAGGFREYPLEHEGELTPEALIRGIGDLTGWDLTLAQPVTDGKGGMSVCLADSSALFQGPPEPQKDEFHMYSAEQLAEQGRTPLFFSRDGQLLGIIAVADVIKADSPQAVRELRNMGIRVVMLTGDNERTARAIGAQAGVDEVIAGVLPDGKERVIRELKRRGRVAMVGDGINDAPALTRADMGIAIGAGTDVAIDAADVVLMKSRLSDVPAAIRLSRATLRNIHQNLFWAFFYNTIGIPLAAGVFIPLGLTLNPMFGAAAMSLSSFCVVSNALRLNLFDLRDPRRDHKIQSRHNKEEETTTMEKTMKIEGMMCVHCEARVKKALEALPEVEQAAVSHEAGTAVVTLKSAVSDDTLKKAVEDQDYTVTGIQ